MFSLLWHSGLGTQVKVQRAKGLVGQNQSDAVKFLGKPTEVIRPGDDKRLAAVVKSMTWAPVPPSSQTESIWYYRLGDRAIFVYVDRIGKVTQVRGAGT